MPGDHGKHFARACGYPLRMPAPFVPPPQPGGLGGVFAGLGAVVGPTMMVLLALQKPGPVKSLLRAGAVSPESARKITTLGLAEPPLKPLIRAGVVVREEDGRIWLDQARARRRQWRIAAIFGGAIMLAGALVAAVLAM